MPLDGLEQGGPQHCVKRDAAQDNNGAPQPVLLQEANDVRTGEVSKLCP